MENDAGPETEPWARAHGRVINNVSAARPWTCVHGSAARCCALFLGLIVSGVPVWSETVKTPVWVEGNPATFEVTLDGEPAEVQSVQTPEDNLILLIVMDTVKHPDRADAARGAIVDKLKSLGPKYFAGVMTAQDGLVVDQDPIRNRKRLREKLDALDVRGLPGLLDTVEQASHVADQTLSAADVRVAVLFVTDGEIADYRGDYTIPVVNPSDRRDLSRRFRDQLILERVHKIVDALEAAQAPMFFLHLARQYDDLNEVYQNGINEFAEVTGGRALFAQSVQEIPPLIDRLLDRIAAHSVLTIDGATDTPKKLDVQVVGGEVEHRERVSRPPASS